MLLIVILQYYNKDTMGLTKSAMFSTEQNQLAQLSKALAHPARIAILQYLIQHQDCICGSLVDEIGLAQATISQHLKELKQVGLIKGEISGTSVCYCIDETNWNRAKKELITLFESAEEVSCCS